MPENREYPDCFGNLDVVFPKGEDGLRTPPETCFACSFKTECLRRAMSQPGGVKLQDEMIDNAADAGMLNFFQRWSRKKQIDRKKKQILPHSILRRNS